MKKLSSVVLQFRRSLSLLWLFATLPAIAQTGIVISQVYGGGGNSGAPYKYDYIELYNPSGSDVSLAGYSIQYASASGSSWNAVALPTVTVASGHSFLIQGAAGTNTAAPDLPVTPDFVMTQSLNQGSIPNFSATTGKVALVSVTTPLADACPKSSLIVDFVGYGSANCYEGSGTAPAPSNTTAILRKDSAIDSNDNKADFAVGAPDPHNSIPIGSLQSSGMATPSSITQGDITLFTVTVTPGVNPASTGIHVTGDLSSIGGATDQIFYDDGTHGDLTAGDNTFSFSFSSGSAVSGSYTLLIVAADAQGRSANASVALTINLPVPTVAIHAIQSSVPSPYVGQIVKTSGVVTGVGNAGFFLQLRDSEADSDPSTPEGIYVYTGSGKVPDSAVIGNELEVAGKISEYPTASHTPATEIGSPLTVKLLSTGNALPSPVKITAAVLNPSGGLYQLAPYESMRVTIDSVTSTSGTDGNLTESTETTKSNGQFYAVLTGTPRPFREPGIDVRDTLPANTPANVARFDDNPERLLVDSTFLGGAAVDVTTNTVLTNLTGILDLTYSSDAYYDPARLVLDSSYSAIGNMSGGLVAQPVMAPSSTQFTVAAFNVERFLNPDAGDNLYYDPVSKSIKGSSAVNVTAEAYARRLSKVSLAIRNILGSPDIVSLEEIENKSVASDISKQISADAIAAGQQDPQYVAYAADATNDVGGISVGFLVKSGRVSVLSVDQQGKDEVMTNPTSGTTVTLNDRPPLVLHAGVKREGATDYPVTVIANHLRSLSGINDTNSGPYVRLKKELQAEYLAKLIQSYQSNGEHVISVGDYNVFEFSDGYTDVIGTVTGNSLPLDQVVQPGVSGLVSPNLTDLVTLLPKEQRWSYVEFGSAQVLDHILATSDLVAGGAKVSYAHLNADFPLTYYNDATRPERTSDHDAAVGYFFIPTPTTSATLTPTALDFGYTTIYTNSPGQVVTLANTGETSLLLNKISTKDDFAQSNNCGSTIAVGQSCNINVVFHPKHLGARQGRVEVKATGRSTLTVTSSLQGTGLPPGVSCLCDLKQFEWLCKLFDNLMLSSEWNRSFLSLPSIF